VNAIYTISTRAGGRNDPGKPGELGGGVVLANGWVDTKIAESVHELRERSSFSAKIELATRAISQSIAELECASAGSKGKGQRRADLSPAWARIRARRPPRQGLSS
jgi:hypothetical protein